MSDPAAGSVRLECDPAEPGIATLTLSHPGRLNAITRSMWRELRELVTGLADRPGPAGPSLSGRGTDPGDTPPAGPHAGPRSDLRCVIVRGEGGCFAAGADLAEFPDFHFEPASARAFHEGEPGPALQALLECDVPLVAQLEQVCVGGGLEIAACCDLRIAGRGCRFGAPIAKLGFPMAPDELAILVKRLGEPVVAELLLEARLLDGPQAAARGLVHRLVDDDAVAAEAWATARRIAALPALAARINKQTLRQLARGGPDEAERAAHYRYADGAEHVQGVRRFLAGDR